MGQVGRGGGGGGAGSECELDFVFMRLLSGLWCKGQVGLGRRCGLGPIELDGPRLARPDFC